MVALCDVIEGHWCIYQVSDHTSCQVLAKTFPANHGKQKKDLSFSRKLETKRLKIAKSCWK